MIIVYPMLTTDTVSHNVLPGISKALERFVVVYRLEEDLPKVSGSTSLTISLFSRKGFDKAIQSMGESSNLIEANGKKGGGFGFPPKVNIGIEKSGGDQGGPISLTQYNQKDILLEPTYITAQTKNGPMLIGVKVIPFKMNPTKSGQTAADIIQSDKSLSMAYSLAVGFKRALARRLWAMWNGKIGKRFPILTRTVSGDPMKDVVYASTQFSDKTFVCFDSMDLNESFSASAANVKKLHHLGWRSFILADNVNKRASFCMKEFGGMCNIIPYNYLFSSLGPGQKETYSDLEDIKKSSSAFFRNKVPKNKVLGEQLAYAKLNEMSSANSDDFFLQEGLLDFVKTAGKKTFDSMKQAVKTKNPKKVADTLEKLPDVKLEKLKAYGKKQSPDFQKCYLYAKRVIDNSLQNRVDDNVKDHLATGIALKSVSMDGDPIDNAREELKSSIPAIMRAIGSAAGTSAWLLLWYYVSQIVFSFSNPVTLTIALFLVARGIYKHAKKEEKLEQDEENHKRKLDIMAQQAERDKAKANKPPFININQSSNSKEQVA